MEIAWKKKIDGYSIAKQAPNGTRLKSCPFTMGGFDWMIHLFPNGDCPKSADFISVFICPRNTNDRGRVSLQLEFNFIDEVNKQNPMHVRTRPVLEAPYFYGVGYRKFIAREAVENSKHLKGDCFTARCDFIITGYVRLSENVPITKRKCAACNLLPVTVVGLPLVHACFCNVCNDASRKDPTAKQCAGCHAPYQGRYL